MEELVQHCLALDHSLVSTLRRQYKLLQLKKLLHKYEIRNFNFSGTKQGMVGCLWMRACILGFMESLHEESKRSSVDDYCVRGHKPLDVPNKTL